MRYVGRHRGPRPLYLRRPVIGGVAAALLLGGPAFAVSNGGITGLTKKPATGVEASDQPSTTSAPTVDEVTPDDLPSVQVTTKPSQTRKTQAPDTPAYTAPRTVPTTRKTTKTSTPTKTKTPTKTTKPPKPSTTKDPDPEPTKTQDPPLPSISIPAAGGG